MIKFLKSSILSSKKSYDLIIGPGLLNRSEFKNYNLFQKSRLVIITDSNVASLYGEKLKILLKKKAQEVYLFSFKAGEKQKNRKTKKQLENQMLNNNLGSDTHLIALGGGITTDIGGFIAATYSRGIPLIMIPTSLIAMIDASIGGKNGVNTSQGKNLIGTIYQPTAIFIDPAVLISLSLKEIKNGISEMIKHALIIDAKYFEFLENNIEKILALDPNAIEHAIFKSCQIKQNIVKQDEKGQGKRNLLNFGHTIGHAIELLTKYKISHGKAVAIGILTESYLSMLMGFLSEKLFIRIFNIFQKIIDFPISLNLLSSDLLKAMSLDKKALKNVPRFIILSEIGKVSSKYCTSVDKTLLKKTLHWLLNDLSRN